MATVLPLPIFFIPTIALRPAGRIGDASVYVITQGSPTCLIGDMGIVSVFPLIDTHFEDLSMPDFDVKVYDEATVKDLEVL